MFIRFFFLLAHVLFWVGQTTVMWYLYSEINLSVTIQATHRESRAMFSLFQLSNPAPLNFSLHQVLEEFTYMDAIRGLWLGRTGPSNPLYDRDPGFWGKFSAFLLILFSAVWPHVKLLWLNFEFHRKVSSEAQCKSRSRRLYWLDTFGKWSLADVFVICTLLTVLNLDIPVSGETFLQGIQTQFASIQKELRVSGNVKIAARGICQQVFLLQECNINQSCFSRDLIDWASPSNQCLRCQCMLRSVFPEVDSLLTGVELFLHQIRVEGSMLAQIRVKGQAGIYYFCVATLLSLLLSWAIDWLDHHQQQGVRTSPDFAPLLLTNTPPLPLPSVGEHQVNRTKIFSLLTLFLTVLACFLPIVKRKVPGSIMDLVQADFGIALEEEYTLIDFVRLTGQAGGWDILLMMTMALFLLCGPLLRGIVLVVSSFQPKDVLVKVSERLGVFAGWEILLLAFVLVRVEMPSITQGIISPRLGLCRLLHDWGGLPYCISIEFLFVYPHFFILPLATACLLYLAQRRVLHSPDL